MFLIWSLFGGEGRQPSYKRFPSIGVVSHIFFNSPWQRNYISDPKKFFFSSFYVTQLCLLEVSLLAVCFILLCNVFFDRSFRCWNKLPDSFRQPRQSCPIHLLIHLSAHLCHHHHSHHLSLLHSFTPGSKPTFSTNPSHLNTSSTHYTAFTTDLSCFLIYF